MTEITSKVCPVCNIKTKIIWREKTFSAHKCFQCGLIFSASPIYHFDDNYFQQYQESSYERIAHFCRLNEILPAELKPPILDVGAGLGFFARSLPKNLALATTLVEPSEAAQPILQKIGSAGVYKSISEIPPKQITFSTVTFWDVLAHVEDIVDTLKQIKNRMQKDGLLVIKTPFHPDRLFRVAKPLNYLGKGHSLLHIPSMRYHFTPDSMESLLANVGFNLMSWHWVPEVSLPFKNKYRMLKGKFLQTFQKFVIGKTSFVILARCDS